MEATLIVRRGGELLPLVVRLVQSIRFEEAAVAAGTLA
jgi:hypothetical protein